MGSLAGVMLLEIGSPLMNGVMVDYQQSVQKNHMNKAN